MSPIVPMPKSVGLSRVVSAFNSPWRKSWRHLGFKVLCAMSAGNKMCCIMRPWFAIKKRFQVKLLRFLMAITICFIFVILNQGFCFLTQHTIENICFCTASFFWLCEGNMRFAFLLWLSKTLDHFVPFAMVFYLSENCGGKDGFFNTSFLLKMASTVSRIWSHSNFPCLKH